MRWLPWSLLSTTSVRGVSGKPRTLQREMLSEMRTTHSPNSGRLEGLPSVSHPGIILRCGFCGGSIPRGSANTHTSVEVSTVAPLLASARLPDVCQIQGSRLVLGRCDCSRPAPLVARVQERIQSIRPGGSSPFEADQSTHPASSPQDTSHAVPDLASAGETEGKCKESVCSPPQLFT